MSSDQTPSVFAHRPWNKGQLVGQKRPLKPKDVWAIRVRLELNGSQRDVALFDLAMIASFEPVIWSVLRSRTSVLVHARAKELPSYRRRLAVLCSSKSVFKLELPSKR